MATPFLVCERLNVRNTPAPRLRVDCSARFRPAGATQLIGDTATTNASSGKLDDMPDHAPRHSIRLTRVELRCRSKEGKGVASLAPQEAPKSSERSSKRRLAAW